MAGLQKTALLCRTAFARPLIQKNVTRGLLTPCERDAYRARMQDPGHDPVYLRGGSGDKVLLGVTCALIGVGMVHTFYRFYQRAYPS